MSKDLGDQNDLQLEDVEDYTSGYSPEYTDGESEITDTGGARRSVIGGLVFGNKKVSALIAVVVALVAAIVVIVVTGGSESGEFGYHQPLIIVDPSTLDPAVTGPLMETLEALYDRHGLETTLLRESAGDGSPLRRAFYWLAQDNQSVDHSTKMTRYALACLYYSSNQVPHVYDDDPLTWYNARRWLTSAHVCDWHGIECDTQKRVTGLDMERNYLSGYLPEELIILEDTMTSMYLSNNGLHMSYDDFDLFENLEYLEEFVADDNYLEHHAGLPTQMQFLVNMRKLVLSYNLMEGEIDSEAAPVHVLSQMTKLSHLELESNFFTGTMPGHVGRLDRLVYLYMRRNNLKTTLNFLDAQKTTKLFALWLDGNAVNGTIPTQIGGLTNLASISLANNAISGSIPTEIGNLKGLRRLWLDNNQLTGTVPDELQNLNRLEVMELHGNDLNGSMPSDLCTIFENSKYKFKALTSDCSSVTCTDCCTKCF